LIVSRHRATLQVDQDSHDRVWEWEATDVTQIAEKDGVLGIEFKVRGSNAPQSPNDQPRAGVRASVLERRGCKCTRTWAKRKPKPPRTHAHSFSPPCTVHRAPCSVRRPPSTVQSICLQSLGHSPPTHSPYSVWPAWHVFGHLVVYFDAMASHCKLLALPWV
jgi:hypothetical protein